MINQIINCRKANPICKIWFLSVDIILILLLANSLSLRAQGDLERAFRQPSFNARPWVYWYWMNGNVSKEGIIADFKGFHDVGIGGVNFMDIGIWPRGPVSYHSKKWYDLVRVALAEAKKYGIRVNMGGCPGWSSSGGPWITPDMSMKELTWSEARVNDKNGAPVILKKPFNNLNYYHDIAVLAFPSPKGDNWLFKDVHPKITDTSGKAIHHAELLYDGDLNTTVSLPAKFDIVFDKEMAVNSVFIHQATSDSLHVTIMAWDTNSGKFNKLTEFRTCDSGPFVAQAGDACFPKTRSKKFRILMNHPVDVKEFYLCGGYRLNNWIAKSGIGVYTITKPATAFLTYDTALKGDIIPRNKILNVTDKLEPDGKLNWTPPSGDWTILRIGYTTNGVHIYPPSPGGDGLECDKLSKEGIAFNYQHAVKAVLEKMGPELSRVIECQHIDSYEAGGQNWTQDFAYEFKSRCGYDILSYLPVLTGRVVGSEAISEEFLWDFRHTISDMMIDNHLGEAAKLSHKDGLSFSNEPYTLPVDGLKAGGVADYPMIEFWIPMTKPGANRMRFNPVFAAHVNGKKVIGAEAFTSAAPEVRWNQDPYTLKAVGDYIYCAGVNRFTLHVSAHHPFIGEHLVPGMTCGVNGVHFDRGNTWWEHGAKEYIEYLTRTQSLLQQGKPLADVLYFEGSQSPYNDFWAADKWGLTKYEPELPYGYDFDVCSEDVLVKLKVKNNLLELPFGKSYKYLVLPASGWITTSLLKKVLDLIRSGATVIGSQVGKYSPGLSDIRINGQAERNQIIRKLWGEFPAASGEQKIGLGRIIWGKDFKTILSEDKLICDFSYHTNADLLINTTHRCTDREEIYFVANGRQNAGWATCRFRVKDMVPQFWDSYKGTIKPCRIYKQMGDYIEIPIYFDPSGSIFVVFTKANKKQNSIFSVSHNGVNITGIARRVIEFPVKASEALVWEPGSYDISESDGKTQHITVQDMAKTIPLINPWQLSFPGGWGAPEKIIMPKLIPYSEYPNEGVKYFSGTVTYHTSVKVPSKVIGKNRAIYLDLGRVEVIAKVKVNGKVLGTFWKPPFCMDVSSAIKSGNNQIEIMVTNLWANRLIGDEQYPEDEKVQKDWPKWVLENRPRPEARRMTFTPLHAWDKNDTLLPSGLLGPVCLKMAKLVKIEGT